MDGPQWALMRTASVVWVLIGVGIRRFVKHVFVVLQRLPTYRADLSTTTLLYWGP
jgi:hypothetical protein